MTIEVVEADMHDVEIAYQAIVVILNKLNGGKADYLVTMLTRYLRQRMIETGMTILESNARIVEVMDVLDRQIAQGEIRIVPADKSVPG